MNKLLVVLVLVFMPTLGMTWGFTAVNDGRIVVYGNPIGSFEILSDVPVECQMEAVRTGEKKDCALLNGKITSIEIGFPAKKTVSYGKVDVAIADGKFVVTKTGEDIAPKRDWEFSIILLIIPLIAILAVFWSMKNKASVFVFSAPFILLTIASSMNVGWFFLFFLVLMVSATIYVISGTKGDGWLDETLLTSLLTSFCSIPLFYSAFAFPELTWTEKDMTEYVLWLIGFCVAGFVLRIGKDVMGKRKESCERKRRQEEQAEREQYYKKHPERRMGS